MCGIAGLFQLGPMAGARETMQSMLASLVHRGPDAEGIWVDQHNRCALGARRLRVIDPSHAGDQPMASADGAWVIAFNGEIYNFEELRAPLLERGIQFRGHSDTEVLVNCLATHGAGILERLDGMFAFAAFNVATGELILARDPFGEKPLYYVEMPGGGLAFASELQALERLPGFDRTVSIDAMAELLLFQYIAAPSSIYRDVRKLPPGCWLRAAPGAPISIQRYFEFSPVAAEGPSRPTAELVDELEDILLRSLRRRLVADVPLGAFLSGGIDSSLVCALARRKLGVSLRTFSIGFAGAAESEHEVAQATADFLGLEHAQELITPDAVASLPTMGQWLDEPNADWSCLPQYVLSKLARKHVTVAVSGDGGDEMFGGYERYVRLLARQQTANVGWQPGAAYYSHDLLLARDQTIADLFGGMPAPVAERLRRLRAQLDDVSTPLTGRLRRSDVENYLPGAVLAKVDRMSMQHSLEVRTPFLCVELARFVERLPEELVCNRAVGKILLRELARRYLPAAVVDRPKTGFGLPNLRWAQAQITAIARKLLGDGDCRMRGIVGTAALDAWLASGPYSNALWSMSVLESWLRHHA